MIKMSLDNALKTRNMSRYELSKQTGIQYQIIDNYYKNKIIRYDRYILNKICTVLDCRIEEIICFEKEN